VKSEKYAFMPHLSLLSLSSQFLNYLKHKKGCSFCCNLFLNFYLTKDQIFKEFFFCSWCLGGQNIHYSLLETYLLVTQVSVLAFAPVLCNTSPLMNIVYTFWLARMMLLILANSCVVPARLMIRVSATFIKG